MRKVLPIALFCSLGAVSQANAETVEFTADVQASCTISNISNGSLVATLPDNLTSTGGGGVSASFNVTNNSASAFKVVIDDVTSFDTAPATVPTQIAFTTAPRISDGSNRDLDNRTDLTTSTEFSLDNEGEDTFTIDLTAFAQASGATFPVGNYVATTTVTCTTI
mgnify:CR=1 FL=1